MCILCLNNGIGKSKSNETAHFPFDKSRLKLCPLTASPPCCRHFRRTHWCAREAFNARFFRSEDGSLSAFACEGREAWKSGTCLLRIHLLPFEFDANFRLVGIPFHHSWKLYPLGSFSYEGSQRENFLPYRLKYSCCKGLHIKPTNLDMLGIRDIQLVKGAVGVFSASTGSKSTTATTMMLRA